jgi:hypothetical protein
VVDVVENVDFSPGGIIECILDVGETITGDVAGNIAEGLGYETEAEQLKGIGENWNEMLSIPDGTIAKVGDQAVQLAAMVA